MGFPAYVQALIDAGEVTPGINDGAKSASFIDFPHKIEREGLAGSKLEAVALGMPTFVNEKGKRVTVKTTEIPEAPGTFVVENGKNIDTWGRDNLARNNRANALRSGNARLIEVMNMDELEPSAAKLYGTISQSKQKDAHHIVGINSAARHIQNMPERRVEPFKSMARHYGLYTADHPRNLSAIPGERAIREPNLHQSVIHTATDPRSVTALLKHFGLPNSTHTKWDLVKDVPRQYNSQREAAALADFAIERLSVQLAMLDPKSPGAAKTIEKSIALIEKALRNTEPMGSYTALDPQFDSASTVRKQLPPLQLPLPRSRRGRRGEVNVENIKAGDDVNITIN